MNASENRPVNVPGGVDTIGHSSIQPWSAGPIFPAVIFRRDVHDTMPAPDGSYALLYTAYGLILDGVTRLYASYKDAELVARFLVDPVNSAARAAWRDCSED